jgi:hypothetical protein
MTVGADAEQHQVERGIAELALVLLGRRVALQLAADAVNRRQRPEPREERVVRDLVVRALVVGLDATLVAPPDGGARPVGPQLRRAFVRLPGGFAAGEGDLLPRRRGVAQQLRGDLRPVVADVELDVRQADPAASSRDLSIAASIAFRNAARTPARSSS